MVESEVTLPAGKTYAIIVETDSYAGNFERQLCGFATGIWDEERFHGETEANNATGTSPDMVARIANKGTTRQHHEYGDVSNTIAGKGGKYNNVAIFLSSPLDGEEIAFVKDRSALYGKKNNIGILDIYQIEYTVSITETRLG